MIKKIVLVLVVVIGVFCAFAAMQPDDFRVERSATIKASATEIFAHVNDLHKWREWSPWAKLDPNAVEKFSGTEFGAGAVMSWSGNMDVGVGSMTITDSKTDEIIKFRLDFEKPLANTANAEFTFKADGGKTVVTWSMYGKKNFISKAMGLVFGCEKIVGGMFEQGLVNLAAVTEKQKSE